MDEFKDSVAGHLTLCAFAVYVISRHMLGDRYPRVTAWAMLVLGGGFAWAGVLSARQAQGSLAEFVANLYALGTFVAAAALVWFGIRRLQRATPLDVTARSARAAGGSSRSRTRLIIPFWSGLLGLGITAAVFYMVTYGPYISGVLIGKRFTCRWPDDPGCYAMFSGLALTIGLVCGWVAVLLMARFLRWRAGN